MVSRSKPVQSLPGIPTPDEETEGNTRAFRSTQEERPEMELGFIEAAPEGTEAALAENEGGPTPDTSDTHPKRREAVASLPARL